MATYPLQVISLDGPVLDQQVKSVKLRTIDGDVEILARHMNYCTAIGMGTAEVTQEDGSKREAACIGGMILVMNGECKIYPTTWEWQDEIDVKRAQRAKERAEEKLAKGNLSEVEKTAVEAKLYRALVRLSTAGNQSMGQ